MSAIFYLVCGKCTVVRFVCTQKGGIILKSAHFCGGDNVCVIVNQINRTVQPQLLDIFVHCAVGICLEDFDDCRLRYLSDMVL